MNIKNFTIIIPCIMFQDVKESIKKIRKIYKNIKIIICLNDKKFNNKKDKNLKFIFTKYKGIGKKRNLAVNKCKTKYIAFIDSDAYPKKGWLESTFKLIKNKNIGIIGGPHIDPPNQNEEEELIGKVKLSYIITMNANVQKKTFLKGKFVNFLPSCNWVLSRNLFNKLNQMDGKMLRNEDWDFVYNRMRKKNYGVFYSPKTIIYHENKTYSDFVLKRFMYGLYMWPILLKFNLFNLYFLTPLFFTIFLLSFPLTLLNSYYLFFYLTILAIYFFAIIFETLRLSKNIKELFKIPFYLIPASLVPGFGIFLGFFKMIINKLTFKNN
jgi:GT2 family glycosyltransferase